jgi:hypothetical protein
MSKCDAGPNALLSSSIDLDDGIRIQVPWAYLQA